ncbi:MAG: DUF87 domain-containing protein [Clostridia bacterium]|nr:DUF87 domain-containing protein [Clostridia bacterium]
MRLIPKTSKVKVEFFRNVSIPDVIIGLIGIGLEILLFLTNLNFVKYIIMVLLLCVIVGLYLPFEGQRFYMAGVNIVKFMLSKKHYSKKFEKASSNISAFVPFKNVYDGFIEYDGYYAGVLQIDPREFRLLSGFRQDQIIDNCFGRLVRAVSGKTKASVVKIDRKLVLDKYIALEEKKKDELYKLFETGEISQEELDVRIKVIDDRKSIYNNLNTETIVQKPFYYFIVYDEDKGVINEILKNGISDLQEAGMSSEILDDKGLAIFLKYQYTTKFEERDVENIAPEEIMSWVLPDDIKFTPGSAIVDGEECYNYTVRNYPLYVLNAWGYQLFNIENTKVVFNIEPYQKEKAVKMIDRSLQELLSQSETAFNASSMIDKQTHINTLVNVLRLLQNDNETLYKCTLHITIYNRGDKDKEAKKNIKKAVKRIVTEQGFDLADNYFKQNRAVISNNISRYDCMDEYQRAIHSSSVAAVFPFVLSSVMDKQGVLLGQSANFPVIVDFFKRDNERVNSNMVILGKTGSGKSYATKTILTGLAAENCKIFILDPENEYQFLATKLGGRLIDVGTATQGRINPFHVITTLDADEEGDGATVNNFAVHLQFLEEFFRVALPGIEAAALEYLNNLIVALYKRKNIDEFTDFSKLGPKDYPIFDDLNALINEKLAAATIDYDIANLRILSNYISKFATGGRNANLWNGESTLTVRENFTVFNFQSLLANKNGVIANAQMLLVLKWLDNEIIKNREFNIKHGTTRKIIVCIDEAHVFIDPKYPVALDFMYQLAKRIRKYAGMQIVITQNIKDFVGTDEIVRKSTAIINACQYSFIFALAPNDMDDLCKLYDKAGKINKTEQDQIVNNNRGHAFIITSPSSRTSIEIVASKKVRALFKE